MSRRRPLWTAARTRRVVQVLFLVVFFALVLLTRFYPEPGGLPPEESGELQGRLGAPAPLLKLFFLIDPLVSLTTALAAHSVPWIALWSLVTVAVTILLGRVFCGWICPLGTIHAIASRLLLRRKDRKQLGQWSRGQLAKYYLLAAFLVGAVFGLHWVCIFDPMVWLTRTTTTALLPAAQWAAEEGSKTIYDAAQPPIPSTTESAEEGDKTSDDTPSGWAVARWATIVTEPAYAFLRDNVFAVHKQAFWGGPPILAVFLLMLALNAWRPRFWCRYLCPLGALLGIFSWRPLLRRKVASETCNRCDLCGMACHGAASATVAGGWKPQECFGCMACSESCPRGTMSFDLTVPWEKEPKLASIDLRKRGLLVAAVGGIAALGATRLTPESRGKRYNPALIRPPGSRAEHDFLHRCTSCGLCMKVCPTGGLQPTLTEAGLEGLWTPMLVPRIGYCDYMCNLCGNVCPT
jgi:polyferredoxin